MVGTVDHHPIGGALHWTRRVVVFAGPETDSNVFRAPQSRRSGKRSMPFDFARLVAVPRLQGAADDTRFGRETGRFCPSSAVRQRGMRLPSDLGVATTNHQSPGPGVEIRFATTRYAA